LGYDQIIQVVLGRLFQPDWSMLSFQELDKRL
jgi:hypothetical protein